MAVLLWNLKMSPVKLRVESSKTLSYSLLCQLLLSLRNIKDLCRKYLKLGGYSCVPKHTLQNGASQRPKETANKRDRSYFYLIPSKVEHVPCLQVPCGCQRKDYDILCLYFSLCLIFSTSWVITHDILNFSLLSC